MRVELPDRSPAWRIFVPKLVMVLRQGYGRFEFGNDLVAGITVAIVALPLSMALAIAAGTTPDRGLVTAVVAGFLVSALGGSRFQIGGPAAIFIVVVLDVLSRHGYDGLILATVMAGAMLIIAGVAGAGTWIKYLPEPVMTGFTAGIAVIIVSNQVRDLLGLDLAAVPADVVGQWGVFWAHRHAVHGVSVAVAGGAFATIIVLRRLAPAWPGFLIAVVGASTVVWIWRLPVDTIGSRFGAIPNVFSVPSWPRVSWTLVTQLLPSAVTIAFLGSVQSLLSAAVADRLAGQKHRPNCELVAQGVANVASVLLGGLPATGAIARTATNVRSGARSPVAGIWHAIILLLFMWILAPIVWHVPLASLAAVLVIVAWGMSKADRFRRLMTASPADRLLALTTFALTVFVDLTVAIVVAVVLAAILFMHRMAQTVAVHSRPMLIDDEVDEFVRPTSGTDARRIARPSRVEVFELRGPFFFGVAHRLGELLERVQQPPRAVILLMRDVPLIDATGVSALDEFIERCHRGHTLVILADVAFSMRANLSRGRLLQDNRVVLAQSYAHALRLADALAGDAVAATTPDSGAGVVAADGGIGSERVRTQFQEKLQ